jgi:pimeloyl-ACP methyl ester carboxylesterase
VLVLHSEEGPAATARFVDLLARHADVVAPSHPGYGRSPLPEWMSTIDDLAYTYLDLLDALDLRDVVLVGCSVGGWIAAELAVKCSDRLAGLVLVNPVGIKVGDRDTRDIRDVFAASRDEVRRWKFHDPAAATPDYTKMSEDEVRSIARAAEATALFTWEPYMHDPKLRHRLHRVKLPSLVLWGASDGLASADYGRAYAQLLDARFALVERAGHHPEIEQPEALVERIVEFLP